MEDSIRTKPKGQYTRVKMLRPGGGQTTISICPGQWRIWSKYAEAAALISLCREAGRSLCAEGVSPSSSFSAAVRDRVTSMLKTRQALAA